MLRQLFRSISRRSSASSADAVCDAGTGRPASEPMALLDRAHSGVSLGLHRRIQFGGLTIEGLEFAELLDACIRETLTGIRPAKAFHRYQAALHLAQYFVHTLDLPGERAECGVFTGFSSLLMCRLLAARRPGFDGAGFHLVDSFEGLSDPAAADAPESQRDEARKTVPAPAYGRGAMAAPIKYARNAMRDFPAARIHKGWIPEVLRELPDVEFAFVHVDVDLYAPTLACLDYFHPRLTRGGVILCDDYGAPAFPGAARAWNEFCNRHGMAFVVLDTGQSVLLRD